MSCSSISICCPFPHIRSMVPKESDFYTAKIACICLISSMAAAKRTTTAAARIGIRPTPGAQATFWGAKRRTGWYARERYSGSTGRQHPPWVGASWGAGKRGEGPYVLNEAIADHRDEIDEMVLAAPMEVFRQATGGGRF